MNSVRVARPWTVLSEPDIERLDEAVMATLEDVGVAFPLERARAVLRENGALVDEGRRVARLPRAVVRQALAGAPRELVLAGRDPACDLRLDLEHGYLSNDASAVEVLDSHRGRVRPSTLADVADSARLVDALANVAYYWGPAVAALDAPAGSRAAHETAAVLAATGKHYQAVTTVGERPARYLVELAAAVAGGRDELRRRPIVSLIQCPVDPLGNDEVALEAALVAAEAGVPCGFLSLTLGCGTAPATPAGNLVVNLAAVIADLVLLQLACPGAPVFMGSAPSLMDLRTGGYTGGGPEDHLMAAAATQMAHHYGLPIAVGTMASGACETGWQAAVDDACSTFASVMSGADMMNGAGLIAGSTVLSWEQLVLDAELFGTVAGMAQGVAVDEADLDAAAILASVESGWNAAPPPIPPGDGTTPAAAATPATVRGSTAAGTAPAAARGSSVVASGDALEWARETALQILADHRPPPLEDDVAAELAEIVACADAEAAAS